MRVCRTRTGISFTLTSRDRQRLLAIVASPRSPPKTRLAGSDHPSERRRSQHLGNHGRDGQVQALCLALAGALRA
jgi:hypothetical protein